MKTHNALLWIIIVIISGMLLSSCEEDQQAPKVPAAPTKLKATALSSTEIRVTWKDNSSNEDGFRVERALFDSLSYTTIGTVAANETLFSDISLAPMTRYAYRVFAFNGAGQSKTSSVTVGTTQRAPTIPNAPVQLRAIIVGNNSVCLTWQDNASNETGFKIERGLTGSNIFFGIDTLAENSVSYEVTGLNTGTSYDFRVCTYNEMGYSEYANIATAIPGTNRIPPLSPSDLTASAASATQVELAWTDNAYNETGYLVERAPTATGVFSIVARLEGQSTSFHDRYLQPTIAYSYRVRAYNSADSSSYSNTAEATTPAGSGSPTAPNDFRAYVKSPTQVWLYWADNATNEEGYIIERSPGATTNFTVIATVAANETTYRVGGLTPTTSYSFRVRAYTLVDSSAPTTALTRTTTYLSAKPVAPTNLNLIDTVATRIYLFWIDNSGNEEGYAIERAPVGTITYTPIDSVGVNIVSYVDRSVQQGTGYSYRVRAYNGMGTSNYSNIATGNTPVQTEMRFINGTSHPIVSLIIDGTQYLQTGDIIPSAQFLPIILPTGRHNYSLKNGYWDGTDPVILYSDTGQFIQLKEVSGKVTMSDPSIYRILTMSNYSAYWEAKYNSGADSVGFRFFSDGTYYYYTGGFQRSSGLYNIVQYGPNFSITFTAGTQEGTLSERPGDDYFTMQNGPDTEPILYYYYKKP